MTLTEMCQAAWQLLNDNPKWALTALIFVLDAIGRNVKSERNLSVIQNLLVLFSYVSKGMDWLIANKTTQAGVVYKTEGVAVSKVDTEAPAPL